MNITDYIINEIKPLSLSDSINNAQKICQNFPISHIPIIENNKFIGCFSESNIRTIENLEEKISQYQFLVENFYTNEKATLIDLISIFAENDCNLIPVLDTDNNYTGYYDLSDILDAFNESPFLHRDSDTLVIEKPRTDFSMSQVTQIVEGNKSTLLGMYISHETIDEIQVTLKIRTLVMNEVIQSFRRYDYLVVTKHVDDQYLEQLKDRADYFTKYLDI